MMRPAIRHVPLINVLFIGQGDHSGPFRYRSGLRARSFVFVGVVVLGGCFGVQIPGELPAEVTWVIDHRADFALEPEGTRFNVAAGTVIDPLSDLSGCWAWSSEDGSEYWQVSVYRFDAATGEFASWEVSTGAFNHPGPRLTASQDGTFRVVDAARIEFAGRGSSISLLTGLLESYDMQPRQVYVTLAGDELLIHEALPSEGPQDGPVYRPFECPG
jgi:hypothetical protein